jgi:hypothetical protein
MSLAGMMEQYGHECQLYEKRRVPDGEGGWDTQYVEGMKFMAAITYDNTLNARVAEKEGMMALYTVTTDKAMPLAYHDVFRSLDDGKVYRVTSRGKDKQTPAMASFQVSQVAAEEWTLEQ